VKGIVKKAESAGLESVSFLEEGFMRRGLTAGMVCCVSLALGATLAARGGEPKGAAKEPGANSVGMKMVPIQHGEFTEMGQKITISKNFFMSATLVTQAQWKAVMAGNDSEFYKWWQTRPERKPEMGNDPSFNQGDNLPVENVRWPDAVEFCKKLSAKEGKTYRLPTEPEWEYACHAGTHEAYCFGDDASKLGDYAWCGANSGGKTHPVGQKKPNAWGLYDMHGNVWQWCSTWFGDSHRGDVVDPQGPDEGKFRMIKGGDYGCGPEESKIAFQNARYDPLHHGLTLGFRVVMEAAAPAAGHKN
jgi:formylglycine-generating enzyme required for sulfatase activity